jgi:hypothetical protein
MRRTIALLVAVVSIALTCGLCPVRAQDESKTDTSTKTDTSKGQPAKVQPVRPYRLDFSFNEVADGKNINTRHYSMVITAGESNEIKIGTRVPVESGTTNSGTTRDTQFQYLDIGTNIWAQLREHGDELTLVVRSDVSNVDVSNLDTHVADRAPGLPVIRQIKISGTTLLVAGKPIILGSMDDPTSKRQFQLEVTATRLT